MIADILANMRETFIVVDMVNGEPYLHEAELGQTMQTIVSDFLEGQYEFRDKFGRWHAPVAVLRISRDAPAENVTEKICDEMLDRIVNDYSLAYDDAGYLRPRPFLDNAMPDWERHLPHGIGRIDREYEREDDPRFNPEAA